MGLLFKLPWGRVCTRQVRQHDEKGKIVIATVPYFRGNPDLYVKALLSQHHNPTTCLLIVLSCVQGSAEPSAFWNHCKAILEKKIKLDALEKAGKAS
jgi:hypothetical protein